MKKYLFILICLFTLSLSACKDECSHEWEKTDTTDEYYIYTCTICGEDKKEEIVPGVDPKEPLSDEDWENICNKDLYKNCTVEYVAVSMDGSSTQYNLYKITDTLVGYTAKMDDFVVAENEKFTLEESAIQRLLYQELFTKFLSHDLYFIYDELNKQYYTNIDIIVVVELETKSCEVEATFKNAIIKFDADKHLASIECHYLQTTKFNGEAVAPIECNAAFKLYDYGTTIVE